MIHVSRCDARYSRPHLHVLLMQIVQVGMADSDLAGGPWSINIVGRCYLSDTAR